MLWSKAFLAAISMSMVLSAARQSAGQQQRRVPAPSGQQGSQRGFEPRQAAPRGDSPRRVAGPAPAGALELLPPFRLTAEEEATLDMVLAAWEQRTERIKTLSCDFVYRSYMDSKEPTEVLEGELRYMAPDKGEYKIENHEYWVCDGKSLFQFKYDQRVLFERQLPPEMQGKAIANSPLPFVFGTRADELKRRYSMRVLPAQGDGQVWLEARPLYRQDAASFRTATIILDDRKLLPVAVELVYPDAKTRNSHVFDDVSVNNPIDQWRGIFSKPRTPRGWKRVVEPAPTGEHLGQSAPPRRQALRSSPPPR